MSMVFWKRATARGLALSLVLAALIVVGVMAGGGSRAFASAPTETCTQWSAGSGAGAGVMQMRCDYHNATDTIVDVIPCVAGGAPANITLTYNGVFHVSELTTGVGAGTFWATGTQTGTVYAAPLDPSLPTYTGHFTTWFGDNNNLHNGSETSTFSVHATGSDGSSFTFHDVAHMSVSATGVAISFDKPTCNA